MEQNFNLAGESVAFVSAQINAVSGSGFSEIVLTVDGVVVSRSLDYFPGSSTRITQPLSWTGSLSAGDHIIAVKTGERPLSSNAGSYCHSLLPESCVMNTLLLE